MQARRLALGILICLGCSADPPPVPPRGPEPPGVPCLGDDRVDCEITDKHSANAAAASHTHFALLRLLVARQYARFVYPGDTSIDPAIRSVLLLACGVGAPGMDDRRDIALNTDIDKLFPPVALKTAITAGCGTLTSADGKVTRGERIYWR